jgi:hypothetical protein
MRRLSLVIVAPAVALAGALAACGPNPPVVKWARTGTSVTERIELKSSGDGSYISTLNGIEDKNERVILTKEQVEELAELLRSKHACELAHDPAYTPAPEEGEITLELAFPDLHCKIVLWALEWQQPRAKDIAETMQSMKPLRVQRTGRQR